MELVTIKDKTFRVSIPAAEIDSAVAATASRINAAHKDDTPVFLCVLNGAFMFASDLLKKINIECEISFVKLASYHGGMTSTGSIKKLIGLNNDLKGRTIIIVEDIVDTGNTIESLMDQLAEHEPAAVHVAALLFKPEAYTKDIPIDYVALEVPNLFLVGYGLDYDQLGRNLEDIYVLHES